MKYNLCEGHYRIYLSRNNVTRNNQPVYETNQFLEKKIINIKKPFVAIISNKS